MHQHLHLRFKIPLYDARNGILAERGRRQLGRAEGLARLVVDAEDQIAPAMIGQRCDMKRKLGSVLRVCGVHPGLELDTQTFIGPGNEVGQV